MSRIRFDKFTNKETGSQSIQITGRRDHTFFSDQRITEEYDVVFKTVEEEKTNDLWYFGIVQPNNSGLAHVEKDGGDVTPIMLSLDGEPAGSRHFLINELIEDLHVEIPGVSGKRHNCRPWIQSKILPYLCSEQQLMNTRARFTNRSLTLLDTYSDQNLVDDFGFDSDDMVYRYFPSQDKNIFINAVPDLQNAAELSSCFITHGIEAYRTRFIFDGLADVAPPPLWDGGGGNRGLGGLPMFRQPFENEPQEKITYELDLNVGESEFMQKN